VTSAIVEICFDCNKKIDFWILSMLFVVSEDLSFFLGVHLLKFPACSVSCIGATM
jgi:hypothetical protein